MDRLRYQRVCDIFHKACGVPPGELEGLLQLQCGDDEELRALVEELLSEDRAAPFPTEDVASAGQHDVDPGISLDEESKAWQGVAGGLLERLRRHSPPETKHTVVAEIGRGGMGAVYKVVDSDLRRTLAMKVIREEAAAGSSDSPATDPRTLGRFLEEAQITGQLHHPGIVPVHELGLDSSGRVFFTMQLVKGQTFANLLEWVRLGREGWNQARSLAVLLDVLDAMAYAHSRGVIHRDLKPANVMVGKFGETYVLDWGVARVLGLADPRDLRIQEEDSSVTKIDSPRQDAAAETPDSPLRTMDGMVVGTPAYMSPEQALGMVAKLDARSDVYAVGAMLYQLLTEQMPYVPPGANLSPRGVHALVMQGPPKPVLELARAVPAELVAICEKAMAREQEQRYASCKEMAEDLRAYLEHRVVRAYRTGALVEARKWVERNKAVAGIAGALVVVLIAGAAVVYGKNQALFASNRELTLARATAEDREQEANRERARAERQREIAQIEKNRADAERDRVLRLADVKTLRDLRARAVELWPVHPARIPALEQWLRDAQPVLDRFDAHRVSLAELGARSLSPEATDPAAIRFEEEKDAWWYETLHGLVEDLAAFADEQNPESPVASVRGRLARSRTIRQRSIVEHEVAWKEAFLFLSESERYDYLEIEPQLGLVPLGEDPDSGLLEFWVVESGERPERDPLTDRWRITGETGLILVLLPGGTFWMGATLDPAGPNADPDAQPDESLMELALAPFFLSKYEMTQGQWQRLAREAPSFYGPLSARMRVDWAVHPVEQVSWVRCQEVLRRWDLLLPTEARWEYAARAGTGTPWWTGPEPAALAGAANLADRRYLEEIREKIEVHEWDDGFPAHAPVGYFAPNPFGLHDVIGNVLEWCQDAYVAAPPAGRENDGLRASSAVEGPLHRVVRGGSFHETASLARMASRNWLDPALRSLFLGLRPARELDR